MSEVFDRVVVELALSGPYYIAVLDDTPTGFWLCNELLSATGCRDWSGNARHGTYVGGVTFGTMGPFPHGGTAVSLNGSTGYITMGDVSAYEFAGAFSVSCVFKCGTQSADACLVSKQLTGPKGWALQILTNGKIAFGGFTSADAEVFYLETDGAYDDDEWHHVMCTWDGTTAANKVQIYVDGAVVKQEAAVAGTVAGNAGRFLIGAKDQTGSGDPVGFFDGEIAGVAVDAAEWSAARAQAHYFTTQWNDVSDDVEDGTLSLSYGVQGSGPLDRVAHPGVCEFSLRNDDENIEAVQGAYSPGHANARANFGADTPVRVRFVYGGTSYPRFWGRLVAVDPEPGQYKIQRTRCVAHDYAYVLSDTLVTTLASQSNIGEADAMRVLLEALPPLAQPMAVDFDGSLDTFARAFHDFGSGAAAIQGLEKPTISAWGRSFVGGNGTAYYRNRVALSTAPPIVAVLDDDDIIDVVTPATRGRVFDGVRTITHPNEEGATDTEVLWAATTVISIPPGETIAIEGEYTDPSNRDVSIGGDDFQDPLVENTDYEANTAANGSGSDISTDIDVVAALYGSTFRLTITNNNGSAAYLVDGSGDPLLQIRGRGLYDRAPIISRAGTSMPQRQLEIDLFYQDDRNVGQAIADFVQNERASIRYPVESVSFLANVSSALMGLALTGEVSNLLTVSETMTGLDEAQVLIQRLTLELRKGSLLYVTLGVVPVVVGADPWILGTSELDTETVLAGG